MHFLKIFVRCNTGFVVLGTLAGRLSDPAALDTSSLIVIVENIKNINF